MIKIREKYAPKERVVSSKKVYNRKKIEKLRGELEND
jgi:hypothetical protein